MTQDRASRFSAAPTELRSSSIDLPSPSGLGSRLAVGPLGLASTAILPSHFLLDLPQASRPLPRHAPRLTGTGGMTKWRAALVSKTASRRWRGWGKAHRRSLGCARDDKVEGCV